MRKYDPTRPFRPYLIGMAHNAWVDWVRRQARAPDDLSGGEESLLPPVGTELDREELRGALRDALATLDQKQLTFFLLWEHGLGKLKQSEIAFWLGCSVASVTNLKTATLRQLADCLTAKGFS